jgi:hypothetical protein
MICGGRGARITNHLFFFAVEVMLSNNDLLRLLKNVGTSFAYL